MRLAWVYPEDLLPHQLVQSRAEGVDVAAATKRWTEAGGSLDPLSLGTSNRQDLRTLAAELLTELDAATPAPDPVVVPSLDPLPTATNLPERVLGGWTGRAAGCLLGKPVEGMSPDEIRAVLTVSGQWPPRAYITAEGMPDDVRWHHSADQSLRENLDGMPEDDDLNYAIL